MFTLGTEGRKGTARGQELPESVPFYHLSQKSHYQAPAFSLFCLLSGPKNYVICPSVVAKPKEKGFVFGAG